MRKIIFLFSTCLLLFACEGYDDPPTEFDDSSLASSISDGVYSARYKSYLNGEQVGESPHGGWVLHMSKIDDTHVKINFQASDFTALPAFEYIYIHIYDVLVTGVLYDVKLSCDSDSGKSFCVIDEEPYYFTNVSVDGWMKSPQYLETRDGGYGRYGRFEITIAFTLEDGREFRYEIY